MLLLGGCRALEDLGFVTPSRIRRLARFIGSVVHCRVSRVPLWSTFRVWGLLGLLTSFQLCGFKTRSRVRVLDLKPVTPYRPDTPGRHRVDYQQSKAKTT